MKNKIDIQYLPIASLTPYEKNARKHKEADLDTIIASIQQFGMNDPIGIWGEKNIIVEGHGRCLACKKLGIKTVPTIRLDHLTDEERKAYALAHNRTAENSAWDFEILDQEIGELVGFDFEQFGFELVDEEYEHEIQAMKTQERVERILNLDKAKFDGEGKYDIPKISPVTELPPIKEWVGFNEVLSDKEPQGKAVHFFIDDYQFERVWKNPERYIEKLKQYVCVASPDFSPYADMPNVCQLFNHYRKHWVAAYLQSEGITVIPTIRASRDERSLEWYLDGEPHEGIVLISSMWTNTKEDHDYFLKEYGKMKETLNPTKTIIYGPRVKEITDQVEYLNTFTKKRFKT